MLLPKCVKCGSRKSRFIKEKETSGLLSSFGNIKQDSIIWSYFILF